MIISHSGPGSLCFTDVGMRVNITCICIAYRFTSRLLAAYNGSSGGFFSQIITVLDLRNRIGSPFSLRTCGCAQCLQFILTSNCMLFYFYFAGCKDLDLKTPVKKNLKMSKTKRSLSHLSGLLQRWRTPDVTVAPPTSLASALGLMLGQMWQETPNAPRSCNCDGANRPTGGVSGAALTSLTSGI